MVNNFLNRTVIAQEMREGIDKWDLHSKRNSHYTKKAAYRMGENLCQLYI
jgi:hypothetical protein